MTKNLPIQAKIITVSDKFNAYAQKVKQALEQEEFKVEIDSRIESISRRVREALTEKVPLIITLGEKEEQNNTVSFRSLDGEICFFGKKIEDLIQLIKRKV